MAKFIASRIKKSSATVDLKVSIMVDEVIKYCDWISSNTQLAAQLETRLKEMRTKGSFNQPFHTVQVRHDLENDVVEVWRVTLKGEDNYLMWRIFKVD